MRYAQFIKPSRYIGHEINAVKKPHAEVSIALAFPDLYEVGMSHIGLKILYEVINNLDYAAAERVFMPALDMAAYIKANKQPLCTLETGRPVIDFDLLGLSLQYELSYTTVLEFLSLSGIAITTEDRLNSQNKMPIVIAGGPCTVNPLPMSPFIDAFFIGEAEEAIVELMQTLRGAKQSGIYDRLQLLNLIATIEGFYVPVVHQKKATIRRRFVEDLDKAPFPLRPVVPYMSVVHDRIAIEITRGCPRGCRFCQAGVIYRPFRGRSVKTILSIAEESVRNTGHDTVSFASLSAGDYSCLLEAMRACNSLFSGRNVSLSLPSLRVGSVNSEILKELKAVRKSGFTIAPEAATDRLRRVINKDFTNEDYKRTLIELFEAGWLNLKLYFMIGLPTERWEDIEAISKMAHRAIKVAKARTKRYVNVSVTVSPFIPKAHTAFQWCGQIALEQIEETLSFLRGRLANKGLKYKGHDPKMSLLEAVLARGDEGLAMLIRRAWELGAVLDGWSEHFNFALWQRAADAVGIDINEIAQQTYEIDKPLPWDIVDTGVEKAFLIEQYRTAHSEQLSPPCDRACSQCGLDCSLDLLPPPTADPQEIKVVAPPKQNHRVKVRACFSKTGHLRDLSHLEISHLILRALRRADVKVAYSQGFNPSPLVSFSPPLSVGVEGLAEYFDMEVFVPFDIQLTMHRLNNTLPEGAKINQMALIPFKCPSLTGFIRRYDYLIKTDRPIKMEDCLPEHGLLIQREGKVIDLKASIYKFERVPEGPFYLSLIDRESQKARLAETVQALFGCELSDLDVTRTALYGYDRGWVKPL